MGDEPGNFVSADMESSDYRERPALPVWSFPKSQSIRDLDDARTVESEETRLHLRDAHDRVMSVATVQQQLQGSAHGEAIELGPYLSRLCETLAASMIGDSRSISVKVEADSGTALSGDAVSIGLMTTELVINALKHAFPGGGSGDGEVLIRYQVDEAN